MKNNQTNILIMRKIVLMMGLMIGLVSCEEKEISLYPNFKESVKFNINTEGFEKNVVINSSQINDAVKDVVDDDGSVEKVILEGIWFEVSPKTGNTATDMVVDFYIKSSNSDIYLPVLEDYNFAIKQGKVNFIKYLQKTGVDELKKQLNAIAKEETMENIGFKASGTVTPAGSKVDVDIEVFINASVVYKNVVGM